MAARRCSLQLDAVEYDPFVEEVGSTSTLSVLTSASTTAAASEIIQSRKPDREHIEATTPLETKEHKRRGRPRKQPKQSGRRHQEEDVPTRRRDESDSDGEGNGKAEKGNRNGSRQDNGLAKGGSDRESKELGTPRKQSPRGQRRSCAIAMAYKAPTVKSVVRPVHPFTTTVSERAVLPASPTLAMATARSKWTPVTTPVGSITSCVQMLEKGVEKQSTFKSANLRKDGQDDYSGGRTVRYDRDGETKESG